MRSSFAALAFALLALGAAPERAQAQPTPPATPPAAQPTPPAPTPPAQPTPPTAQPTPPAAQPTPTAPGQPPPPPPRPGQGEQPKPAPRVSSVCPGRILPMAVGNVWTYESVQAETSPPENMAKLLPLRPVKIVIAVTGVETKGQDTTVKLKETISYDITRDEKNPKKFDQTVESTIICSPRGRFDISPESFFFAGEPGGFHGLVFNKFDRKKETSLKLTGGVIGEAIWIEEIAAEFSREAFKGSLAKLGGGKLEMERKFTPQPIENVRTRYGTFRTEKLGLVTTGRIMLETKFALDGKPCVHKKLNEKKEEVAEPTEICELPANWITQIWLAENIGLVQVLNPFAHKYQLVDAKLN